MANDVAVKQNTTVALTEDEMNAKLREMMLSGDYSYEDMAKMTGQEPEKTGPKYLPTVSIQKSPQRKWVDDVKYRVPAPSFWVTVPGKGLVFAGANEPLTFRIFQSRWQIRRWDAKNEKYAGMTQYFTDPWGNAIDDQGDENCGAPTEYYNWKKGELEDPVRHEYIKGAKRSNVLWGIVSPFWGVDIKGEAVHVDKPFLAMVRLPRSSKDSMESVRAAFKADRLQQFLVELTLEIGDGEVGNDFFYFPMVKYEGKSSVVTLDPEVDIAFMDAAAEDIKDHNAYVEEKHHEALGKGPKRKQQDSQAPLDDDIQDADFVPVDEPTGKAPPPIPDDLDDEIPF